MKRIRMLCILTVFAIIASFTTPVSAAEAYVTDSNYYAEIAEKLEDGSYFVIEIFEYNMPPSPRAASTKTGSKSLTYKNSNGVSQWTLTVTGTFEYTGSSSKAKSSSSSVTIHDSHWSSSSKNSSVSGNTATANATMICKVAGITTATVTKSVSLSCNSKGTLS